MHAAVNMCCEPVIYVMCTAVSGVLVSLQEYYFLTVQPNQGVFYNELETRCVCICVYVRASVHVCKYACLLGIHVQSTYLCIHTYVCMCVLCSLDILHMRSVIQAS